MSRKAYVRPMQGWWRRDPYFVRYMVREATSLFVLAYALLLLVTLERLAEGRVAFDAWVAMLRGHGFVALHLVLFAAFVVHTITWFQIMPKTMAPIVVAGKKVPALLITASGLGASVAASVVLYVFLRAAA